MSAPFKAGHDQIFVKVGAKTEFRWRLMTPEVAADTNRRPILCNYCKSAASQLDHHWPYHNEMTACDKCAGQKKWLTKDDLLDSECGITP